MKKKLLFIAIGALLWRPFLYAEPSPKNDAAQQALKKAQGILHKLTEEKAAIEQEKTNLIKEKDVLQARIDQLDHTVKQLTPLQSEIVVQKNTSEALRGANGSLNTQLNEARENIRQLKTQQQTLITQTKTIQNDNQLLLSAVKEREKWIAQCSEKNHDIIDAAQALAQRYDNKSFWQQLGESEPFTGIGNVEVQNELQQYEFNLNSLKAHFINQ